jgi:hypothetical protein
MEKLGNSYHAEFNQLSVMIRILISSYRIIREYDPVFISELRNEIVRMRIIRELITE